MQANRGRDTSPEVALRSRLHKIGFRFRKHQRPIKALRCHADVVFPRERVAVFVDGCFWHDCPVHGRRPQRNAEWWRRKIERNVMRDRRNNRVLASAGWLVIRIWEHEEPVISAARVAEHVRARR
jgi:DNA mismatch endonuclease (patch repair protein)